MPAWIDALRRLWRARRERPGPDAAFWETVERTIPYSANIPPAARERVRRLAARFLATKTFYGAHGLPITDALAGNIAWQAALVAHRTGLGIYDDFVGVIVYPEPFRVRRRFADEIGLVHEFDDELYGETWDGGPVIVSWGTDEEEGVQVVLHEFAHRLDLADGALDGVPPLPPSLPRARWESVMETALQRLQDELDTGKSPPLRPLRRRRAGGILPGGDGDFLYRTGGARCLGSGALRGASRGLCPSAWPHGGLFLQNRLI